MFRDRDMAQPEGRGLELDFPFKTAWVFGTSFVNATGQVGAARLEVTSLFKQDAANLAASGTDEFARETLFIPTDPLFSNQWHNAGTTAVDINITEAWDYFTGAGISFGVYDDGIDDDHADLAANYDASLHVSVNGVFDDPTIYNPEDGHGTSVAGLIAALQGNGQGGVGGAFNGSLTGVDIFGAGGDSYLFGAANQQDLFDVTNHSWGWIGPFADNRLSVSWSSFFAGIQDAAANGRDGLGTIQMVAAGNDRDSDDNANTSNFTSSRFVNAIAAIANDGQISYYSTPGASLLVSAPSSGGTLGITTTDYTGSSGYSGGSYTSSFGGTSAAAPIASGVVGLMLEANPELGYRDVMEILAITARQIGSPEPVGVASSVRDWQFNTAANWNNGGMHFSHDYGFGLIDAFAAVKLAESWNLQQTFANELVVSASNFTSGAVPDNNPAGMSRTVELTPVSGTPLTIEAIEVQINWSTPHTWSGDLVIELISPAGTTSYLLDRAGGSGDLSSWTFTTRAHLGELATGDWTVRITDMASRDVGTVSSIQVRAYGSSNVDDNYYYTDEFGAVSTAAPAREVLADADGGIDTINVAALSGAASINLTPGEINALAGSSFVIAAGSVIENVIGSWSADTIEGNTAANTILGNHGDDIINANAGDDLITGGKGSDTVDGGEGTDYYFLEVPWNAVAWVATGITVSFTFIDELLGIDAVSNVEQFIDSLGEQVSWEALTGSPPVVLPAAPVIAGFADNSGGSGDAATNDATPTLTITAEADVESVEVFINGVSHGFATGANGSFTFTPASELADGAYDFTATATRGEQTGAASAPLSVTIDTLAPALASLKPADDAGAVGLSANIVLTFDENVYGGGGDIEIRLASNDAVWRSISVSSPEVSISGNQVTINPAVNLLAGTTFYVTIANGALTDIAGNVFAGISGTGAYNFTTSAGNIIEGNDYANTLAGTSGNDIILGYGGNDRISGNGGNDTIDGGAGNDVLSGGGNTSVGDTVTYASATAAVKVTLASTISQNTGGAGSDTLSAFENLTGSNFNDRLTGSTGANVVDGGLGNDFIVGGLGADILWGGGGADTFDFNAINETGNTAVTRDVIMDFEQGVDRIDLSTVDASSALLGNNVFVFTGEASSFQSAPAGEIRFVHENGMTVIYGDTDRDPASEFQITLAGTYTLTALDFIV
jgi:Ca2+-binding RTX toxin-like protein/subtilisin-like proprotein convertase family protein